MKADALLNLLLSKVPQDSLMLCHDSMHIEEPLLGMDSINVWIVGRVEFCSYFTAEAPEQTQMLLLHAAALAVERRVL